MEDWLKNLKVGDRVELVNSGENWHENMTKIVKQNPVVRINSIFNDGFDDKQILFAGDQGFTWTSANKHFKEYIISNKTKEKKENYRYLIKILKTKNII